MSKQGKTEEWKAVSIKLDPRIDQLLAEEAKRECRTKTHQLRFILQSHFEGETINDRVDS